MKKFEEQYGFKKEFNFFNTGEFVKFLEILDKVILGLPFSTDLTIISNIFYFLFFIFL